jgi:LysM repeat protein
MAKAVAKKAKGAKGKVNQKTKIPHWQSAKALLHTGLAGILLVALTMTVSPPTAFAQSPCGDTVTVVAGDTLQRIAARCNTTVQAILELNPQIRNRNLIYIGQVLDIPSPEDVAPGETAVLIEPDAGPPGSTIDVTARNFPANTEVTVGIGEPATEPTTNFRATTNANGTLNTQITVPEGAQPNQQFMVVVYVPGPGGARATSQEFITTSGQSGPGVIVRPEQGPPGTMVRLQSGGFAPNTPVEIGFGRVESEYDIIAQAMTNADGGIDRQVSVPSFAQPGDEYIFVVTPPNSPQDIISNVFTVTDDGQERNSQVAISPRTGPPGSTVQAMVSGFPANTRISYGIGERGGQLLNVFSARTNRSGTAPLTLPVPEFVEPDTELMVTVYVPQPDGVNVMSAPFIVTQPNTDGDNLFTRTNIYLIALEDMGQSGMEIGCGDSVVPVEVEIEPTIAPLTAALETLLNLDERFYGQSGLYNALYRFDLAVDRIDIVDSVASIYLTGELQVGGVCDEPRVRAQLEETALQYVTVDEVRIFVNGEPLAF